MNVNKLAITGITIIAITCLFAPSVQAHRKYRPHHKGLPRHVLERHSHNLIESHKSKTAIESESHEIDIFGGIANIVAGALKTLGNTIEFVLGSKAEPVKQIQNIEEPKDFSVRHKYTFSQKHKHPRSTLRRVQKLN